MNSVCFQIYRGYFISLNAGKVFWISSKKLYGGCGKEKESRCFVFTSSTKREVRHFHSVSCACKVTANKCTKKAGCTCKVVILLSKEIELFSWYVSFSHKYLAIHPHAYAYIINLLMTKGKFAGENHVVEVWKTKHKLKRPIAFFPFSLPSPSPLLKLPNNVSKALNLHWISLIQCLPSSQDISVYPPKILFPFFTTVTVGPLSSQRA